MKDLTDPKEKPLFFIFAFLAALVWGGLTYISNGFFLTVIPFFYILQVLVQSGFISYLKGSGAVISREQFPDLYALYSECCRKIGMKKEPVLVLINGNGVYNALATKFLRTNYVVLYSSVVDALADQPEAIKFYMGHELGHIKRGHLFWMPFFAPVSFLPLIGAAYSRARERTCDNYGLYCCASSDDAIKGMAALLVGGQRWKGLNFDALVQQAQGMKGFWMSYHELIADYPWTVRRVIRLLGPSAERKIPRRNIFVWPFVAITPRLNLMSAMILYLAIIGGVEYYRGKQELSGVSEVSVNEYGEYGGVGGATDHGVPKDFNQWANEEPQE